MTKAFEFWILNRAASHPAACAASLAEQVDPRTVFDAFGTCRLELSAGPLPRGVLMDRYEKEPNE